MCITFNKKIQRHFPDIFWLPLFSLFCGTLRCHLHVKCFKYCLSKHISDYLLYTVSLKNHHTDLYLGKVFCIFIPFYISESWLSAIVNWSVRFLYQFWWTVLVPKGMQIFRLRSGNKTPKSSGHQRCWLSRLFHAIQCFPGKSLNSLNLTSCSWSWWNAWPLILDVIHFLEHCAIAHDQRSQGPLLPI